MTNMHLSAPDWCFFEKSGIPADEYYSKIREIGYEGVEMVDPSRWESVRRAGLKILNMSAPGMQEGLNRRENHAKLVPEIRTCIAQAQDNGISQVILFSGNSMGQDAGEGIENCVRAIEELAKDAESAGITLVFEMLNHKDHPDYQADYSAYGFQVVERVGSPSVKALYDIYHMVRMGEDPQEALIPYIRQVAHLHVAGVPKRNFPGPKTDFDYLPLIGKVIAAGYRGFWGMEFLPQGDVMRELEMAADLFTVPER